MRVKLVTRATLGLVALSVSACAYTAPVTDVTSTLAAFHAKGTYDGSSAHLYFEYSTNRSDIGTSAAQRTATTNLPAQPAGTPGSLDVPVSGLTPNTVYYYDVCGADAQWNVNGGDFCDGSTLSFKTLPTAPAHVNWPSYLFDSVHSSLNGAAKAITPANAGALAPAWSKPFTQSGGFEASPVVYDGSIYIGGKDGVFYQLNETTGAVVNSVNLGKEAACSQSPTYGYGVEDTATVVADPSRGGAPTVYVTGANGTNGTGGIYLWALDASTLKPVWTTDPVTVDTEPGAVGWASPTVSNGTISVGIASGCDEPLVRGGVSVFSQSNGALVGSYKAVPTGSLGGTIWTTPAASGSSTWLSTGNDNQHITNPINGDSFSIVRLQGATKQDIWTVPSLAGSTIDDDFGGSPTLFTGLVGTTDTPMVGACNKNGTYYALRSQSLSSGPVWTYQLAAAHQLCLGAAAWDAGAHQLIAASDQTPSGHPGSIQALSPDASPANRVIWQSYLPCAEEAPPSEDGAGVLAVVTYGTCSTGGTHSLYLYNAHATVSNGSGPPAPQLLKTIQLDGSAFSQPSFADGYLFVANEKDLMAYTAPGAPPPPVTLPPPITPPPPVTLPPPVTPPPPPVTPPPPPVTPPPPRVTPPTGTVSRAEIKAELIKQLAPVGKVAKIAALLKRHGYMYSFRTRTAGTLKIDWYWTPRDHRSKGKTKPVLLAIGKATFSRAGLVKLRVKLAGTGMRILKAARSVTATAKGTYRPTGKPAVTGTKRFVLR